MTHPFLAIPLLAGALFGVAAGIMQSRSVALAPCVFRSAETAKDVRRALTSTAPGKRAIQIQWALLPILLASAFWVGNPLGALGGFAAFMCVRDLIAVKAVVGLSRKESAAE